MRIFILVTSLSRLMKSHVSEDDAICKPAVSNCPAASNCANIGRENAGDPVGSWQTVQVRVSVRANRKAVSKFLPAGKSTVTATAGHPAASARLTNLETALRFARTDTRT